MIKHVKELRRRAKEHREADELVQGLYLTLGSSGEFRGCLIGCLARPIDVTATEGWVERMKRRVVQGPSWAWQKEIAEEHGNEVEWTSAVGQVELQRELTYQFGIPSYLAEAAEWVFENLPSDEAMEWPRQFAEALEDGMDPSSFRVALDQLATNASELESVSAGRMFRDQLLAMMEKFPTAQAVG